MVRPSWSDRGTRADVGVAVITTTVISLAIFVLQILDENRLGREDAKRQDQLANQALRLQLGLTANLSSMDLHGQDLREINLPNKHLERADFTNADLTGADLAGAHLERAHLLGANLEGANLAGAYLEGADLRNADFSNVVLDGANLENATLNGARLAGASLSGSDFAGVKAYGTDLAGAAVGKDWNAANLQYDSHTVFPNGKTYACKSETCSLPGAARQSR